VVAGRTVADKIKEMHAGVDLIHYVAYNGGSTRSIIMSMTQAEILDSLGLTGKSPARVVVDFSTRETDDVRCAVIYRQFAGDGAEIPARVSSVVNYLLYDAARGLPVDTTSAIARAAALSGYNFTDAAKAERDNAKAVKADKAAVKAADKEATKAANLAAGIVPRNFSNKLGPGQKSMFDKVKDIFIAAPDKSKPVIIAALMDTLGLIPATAQMYYYKARKEVAA
jgi:hypothetical protein